MQLIPKISIILPVLNEAQNGLIALATLPQAGAIEVIVVDGGSHDNTAELAQRMGAIVIQSLPGRAQQMNAGAAIASGEILLFLHADTQLPVGFDQQLRATLALPHVVAGAFTLNIDSQIQGIRWVERGANWRSRHLQMPYGDQGIFLKAETLQAIGGFPELPIMEDFELMRQLRRQGRIAIAPAAVITSGRRWQNLGVCRTTLLNQVIITGYLLGISPGRLLQWYRRHQGVQPRKLRDDQQATPYPAISQRRVQ